MQSFMKVLLAVKRPLQVLEVGTAVGFSTLLMCEYGQPDMHITTIENYEKRIPIARENFRRAGKEDRITFLTGDAGEILPTLSGRYDMIFMDAAKGQVYSTGFPRWYVCLHREEFFCQIMCFRKEN